MTRWMSQAACQYVGTDAFFRAEYEPLSEFHERATQAKKICARCPVLQNCRQYVDSLESENLPWGVWAGETAQERQARRAQTPTTITSYSFPQTMPAADALASATSKIMRRAKSLGTPQGKPRLQVSHKYGHIAASISVNIETVEAA